MTSPEAAPRPWNESNPEWWQAQVESRGDLAWQWLVNEWAEAAAGTALDVERLARALEALWRKRWGTEPSKGTVTWNGAWAEDIAAAYQREEGA